MISQYYAHSSNNQNKKHSLYDHLLSTANLAEQFAKELEISDFAYYAALMHDLGKFHPEFQMYLDDPSMKRTYKDHSSSGAVYMSKLSDVGFFSSWMIEGHHKGLANRGKLISKLKEKDNDSDTQLAIQIGLQELQKKGIDLTDYPNELPDIWKKIDGYPERIEVWLRMLFSCLVDADYLDTESHFESGNSYLRGSWKKDLSNYFQYLQEYQRTFAKHARKSRLNDARNETYKQCIQAAESSTGIFRLNVPTGFGKTIASIGFALTHALKHKKQRVIVAVPFTSIIDQISNIYKGIFGEDKVLEHHSMMELSEDTNQQNRVKLASQNWDAPIVITTTVQLFESLFSNKPSAVRKLHNVANSVVILDEFQMLPIPLLEPIFSMIKELVTDYNTTFLVSSATPLALDFVFSKSKIELPKPYDIVPDCDSYFLEFQRVRFDLTHLEERWDWERVAEEVRRHSQALIVVNVKKDAQQLYQHLADLPYVEHLSANMCPAHRKRVIETVARKLKQGDPIVLVSTQVVEAGIDLDFPIVFRALGPLDSIIQVAGRCNREGKLNIGTTVIFRPLEETFPSDEYRIATKITEEILKLHSQFFTPEVIETYFRKLYRSLDTDQKQIESLRRSKTSPLQFEEIQKRFKMIESSTVGLVIPFDETARQLIQEQDEKNLITKRWMKQIQMYMVNIHISKDFFEKESLHIRKITDTIYEWEGPYHEKLGVILQRMEG